MSDIVVKSYLNNRPQMIATGSVYGRARPWSMITPRFLILVFGMISTLTTFNDLLTASSSEAHACRNTSVSPQKLSDNGPLLYCDG